MDSKEFKTLFSEMAEVNGFVKEFGGWIKESNECIAVLDLQKSKFGNYYQLIVKVYVHDLWGSSYVKGKGLVKDTGDIFRGTPSEYDDIFDLDTSKEDQDRKIGIENLFSDFLIPFVNEALSRAGIIRLKESGAIHLLPAVEKEINKFN